MLQDLPLFLDLKGYKISRLLHYVIHYNAVPIIRLEASEHV
jgi:hypothetical protein